MENKSIEKLSNELKQIDYNGTVVFGYGEPLLDKNIFKKYLYCRIFVMLKLQLMAIPNKKYYKIDRRNT